MKILFACGGTAGHINPALAVADTIKAEYPHAEILFVGNPNRMEAKLVPAAGYQFAPLLVEGLHRSLRPAAILHNIKAVWYVLLSGKQAKRILQDFQPDIVMGTGGYVSGPIVRMAAKLGLPTVTHESNAFPGVTTKLLARYVTKTLLAVPEAIPYLPRQGHYIVTGNPISPQLLQPSRTESRKALGVGDRVCILSYGGSNGAARINNAMAEVIASLQPLEHTHHIHATGAYGISDFPKRLSELGTDLADSHLDIREYITDMPTCLAAADLVICRAGAMTLSELEAVGRASILIPSPNVAENHQYHNAMVLANHNAAIVLQEQDVTGSLLEQLIRELLDDPQELANIAQNVLQLRVLDGARRIVTEMLELLPKDLHYSGKQ